MRHMTDAERKEAVFLLKTSKISYREVGELMGGYTHATILRLAKEAGITRKRTLTDEELITKFRKDNPKNIQKWCSKVGGSPGRLRRLLPELAERISERKKKPTTKTINGWQII